MNAYLEEIAKLRDQVSWLEAEVARLSSVDEDDVARVARHRKVTKGQAKALVAFATGKTFSRERLASIILKDEDGGIRNVDSAIKRLRRRVPWLKISTLYGIGYCVDEPMLSELRRFVREDA